MVKRIKKKLKMLKKKKYIASIKKYVDLNPNTLYGDMFNVEIREPRDNYKFLEIGEHGVIDAKCIFEKDSGHISIGNRCLISGVLISIDNIKIGDDVIIAWDTLVYDHNSHSINWMERKEDTYGEYENYLKYGSPVANKNWSVVKSKPIIIENKVWIGTGCKIMKGVTIGEGAVIAAGSVVVKNVDPWTVVGGNPAQFIKRIER